jgi:hypothetical protein
MIEATELDYMALREGEGVIPEKFRNRGYDKLDYGPGEGGRVLPGSEDAKGGGATMDAFLAGVAAGADPQKLAQELRSDDATPARKRRTQKGT